MKTKKNATKTQKHEIPHLCAEALRWAGTKKGLPCGIALHQLRWIPQGE